MKRATTRKQLDFENEMKRLVALQAAKIAVEYTIVDFTEQVIDNVKNGNLIKGAAENILLDLENEYNKFVVNVAEDTVLDLFNKHAQKIIKQRDEEIIEEVEDLDELEEVTDEEIIEDDDDLDYVIKLQLRNKYIKIEKAQGFYPDDQVWLYQNFFSLDINNREELEQAEQRGIFREMMSW